MLLTESSHQLDIISPYYNSKGQTIMYPIKQILSRMKESILQKKPDESDFHVHLRICRIRVYIFETFQSDFIDFLCQ